MILQKVWHLSDKLQITAAGAKKICQIIRNEKGWLELVSEELNHLAAILHVYAGGLMFMK